MEPSQASGDVCLVLAACVFVLFCLLEDAFERTAVRICGQGFYFQFKVKKAAWEIVPLKALHPTSLLKFFPASRQKTSA